MSYVQTGEIKLECSELEPNQITLLMVNAIEEAKKLGLKNASTATENILRKKDLEHLIGTPFYRSLCTAVFCNGLAETRQIK